MTDSGSAPATPGGRGLAALSCADCGRRSSLDSLSWRCADCAGVLDLTGFAPALPGLPTLAGRPPTLWRYAEALPVAEPAGISLGEGMTPLLAAPGRPRIGLKLDYLMPTGSFKDRGAVLLAALARQLRVPRMVADSSGNAGTAIAAYAARAAIPCDVYVPASTSAGKVAQQRVPGLVHFPIEVEGVRGPKAAHLMIQFVAVNCNRSV